MNMGAWGGAGASRRTCRTCAAAWTDLDTICTCRASRLPRRSHVLRKCEFRGASEWGLREHQRVAGKHFDDFYDSRLEGGGHAEGKGSGGDFQRKRRKPRGRLRCGCDSSARPARLQQRQAEPRERGGGGKGEGRPTVERWGLRVQAGRGCCKLSCCSCRSSEAWRGPWN